MNQERSTRRDFLRQAGVAGGLAMIGNPPRPEAAAAADETPKPTSSVLVRRDIATLAPDGPEIAALRRGFKVLKSRPVDDPLSLIYQANMHLTYDKPARPEWNHCPHGNFFWLPWHRLYTYYFERILRRCRGADAHAALLELRQPRRSCVAARFPPAGRREQSPVRPRAQSRRRRRQQRGPVAGLGRRRSVQVVRVHQFLVAAQLRDRVRRPDRGQADLARRSAGRVRGLSHAGSRPGRRRGRLAERPVPGRP